MPPPKKSPGPPADEPLAGTITQLAEALMLDRGTLRKLLRERGIQSAGTRNRRQVYSLREVIEATRRGPSGDVDLDALSPFERDALTRSLLREDEIRRRRLELLDAADVETLFARTFAEVARALETLPDVLESRAGLTPSALQLAEQMIDEARDHLFQRIQEVARDA